MEVSDAVVVGAGHNGLVAAILLAKTGWNVTVLERSDEPGGAIRTAEVTLPGFKHDLYAANLNLFMGSAFFLMEQKDKAIAVWRRVLELDPVLKAVPADARRRLVASYDHSVTEPEWALGYRWDVVLRGPSATPFEPPR